MNEKAATTVAGSSGRAKWMPHAFHLYSQAAGSDQSFMVAHLVGRT